MRLRPGRRPRLDGDNAAFHLTSEWNKGIAVPMSTVSRRGPARARRRDPCPRGRRGGRLRRRFELPFLSPMAAVDTLTGELFIIIITVIIHYYYNCYYTADTLTDDPFIFNIIIVIIQRRATITVRVMPPMAVVDALIDQQCRGRTVYHCHYHYDDTLVVAAFATDGCRERPHRSTMPPSLLSISHCYNAVTPSLLSVRSEK